VIALNNCNDCRRNWKECEGKEWYHFGEFRFCIHAVAWVIRNWSDFSQGVWPIQVNDDNSATRQIRAEASFVKAALIFAEIDERLKGCTQAQREHLFDVLNAGVEVWNLSYIPRSVLYYLSGARKEMPFSKWQWQKSRRKSEVLK
jgi:hypothetical protein